MRKDSQSSSRCCLPVHGMSTNSLALLKTWSQSSNNILEYHRLSRPLKSRQIKTRSVTWASVNFCTIVSPPARILRLQSAATSLLALQCSKVAATSTAACKFNKRKLGFRRDGGRSYGLHASNPQRIGTILIRLSNQEYTEETPRRR